MCKSKIEIGKIFNRRSLFNMYCCPWSVYMSLEKMYLVSTGDTVDEEVIEVDELDKGNISAAAGKQNKMNNERLR